MIVFCRFLYRVALESLVKTLVSSCACSHLGRSKRSSDLVRSYFLYSRATIVIVCSILVQSAKGILLFLCRGKSRLSNGFEIAGPPGKGVNTLHELVTLLALFDNPVSSYLLIVFFIFGLDYHII